MTNPEAITKCSQKDFESTLVEPEHKFYLESKCPASSQVGENIVLTAVPIGGGKFADVPLKGKVYNLEQPFGLASDFGVALDVSPIAKAPVFAHTFIEGSVEWLSDYHDYFTIKNITPGLDSLAPELLGRHQRRRRRTDRVPAQPEQMHGARARNDDDRVDGIVRRRESLAALRDARGHRRMPRRSPSNRRSR